MRHLLLVVVLTSIGCAAKNAQQSYLYTGEVFNELPLPTPNSIRTGSGAPGYAYWQQQVDHVIQATLDVENNVIDGHEKITYHNNSPDTLEYIWLQLDQNIHNENSTRSREGRSTGEDSYSGMHVSALTIDSVPHEIKVYGTLGKVNLDTPLLPGVSLEMELDWVFPMPVDANLRMGYDDSYEAGAVWELAHWFPAPCVYDDVYGWNTLQYIGRGEFYTNFGDYEVSITVPRDFLVIASGELDNPEVALTEEQHLRLQEAAKSDDVISICSEDEVAEASSRPGGEGDITWEFIGNNIRTFAWATSASFIWEASSVEIDNIDGEQVRILCQSAYPKEAKKYWVRAVDYVKHAIKYYSDTLYPYPWPQMSVVRGAAGGMEYPMLVYCRGSSHEGLFNVTDHEVGHNWFPMLLNSDERRHAWMDEGINTFVNYNSLETYYGDKEHKPDVSKYIARRFALDLKPVNTKPDLLKSRGHLSYRKPGYGLRFLREEILGKDRFDEAFTEYVRRWAFKAPRPADFYRTMEDAAGVDLQWFYRGFFEETLQLDQGISHAKEIQKGKEWQVSITIQNYDDWVCPVALKIECVDGSVHEYKLPVSIWAWSTKHAQSFYIPAQVHSISIDPEEAYPDINRDNNHWYFN